MLIVPENAEALNPLFLAAESHQSSAYHPGARPGRCVGWHFFVVMRYDGREFFRHKLLDYRELTNDWFHRSLSLELKL